MISVIVPVFGVEKFLPQCLDSLINQTCRDLEIILVDDGSPDRCPEICDSFAKIDPRIIVVHQKNQGAPAARNTGLEIAKGSYIGFVDADDWIAPNMFQEMLQALQDSESDLAVCGYEYCNENGIVDENRRYRQRETEILTQKEVLRRMSDVPPTIRHVLWNKLFHGNLLRGIRFQENLRVSDDVAFLTEYMKKIRSAIVIHKPYCYNRVRQGSVTHGGVSVSDLAESLQAHDFMYQSFIKLYPELKNYSQRFLLDVYLLKYNEAKRKATLLTTDKRQTTVDKNTIRLMGKALRNHAWKALFNRDIYWKTRLAYLLVR